MYIVCLPHQLPIIIQGMPSILLKVNFLPFENVFHHPSYGFVLNYLIFLYVFLLLPILLLRLVLFCLTFFPFLNLILVLICFKEFDWGWNSKIDYLIDPFIAFETVLYNIVPFYVSMNNSLPMNWPQTPIYQVQSTDYSL